MEVTGPLMPKYIPGVSWSQARDSLTQLGRQAGGQSNPQACLWSSCSLRSPRQGCPEPD